MPVREELKKLQNDQSFIKRLQRLVGFNFKEQALIEIIERQKQIAEQVDARVPYGR